jgi:hypothetical protein
MPMQKQTIELAAGFPLAEDIPVAGVFDDVVDGQK